MNILGQRKMKIFTSRPSLKMTEEKKKFLVFEHIFWNIRGKERIMHRDRRGKIQETLLFHYFPIMFDGLRKKV